MKKPERKWMCDACTDVYDDEVDAEDCCRPRVVEVWECPVCEETHDTKTEAETCCETDEGDEQDALKLPPQHILESAGQMRMFS